MREIEPEIEKKGARIVLVGNGAPGFIPPFRERTGFKGPVLTDPTRKAFEGAELVRTVRNYLHPRSLVSTLRAAFKGYLPKDTVKGDSLQLGGVLVLRPPAEVAFHYASRFVGDHPANAAVLAALA